MKSAVLLVKCLENEGVKFIFGLPGEENLDMMDALVDSDIRFVSCRHEHAAAFMADVHGRLTGNAGVCLATLGPGATNLVTGVADAHMDGGALVAITGQGGLERMHKESHQVMNVIEMFRPITKWNASIHDPDIIAEVVRKAFKLAQTEKPGATHIELPEDVAEMEIDGPHAYPLKVQRPFPTMPSPDRVEIAVKTISEAQFPVILAGNGVARAGAHKALTYFAERLNIPVATTFMGKGAIPADHSLSLRAVGLQARDYVNCGMEKADVVITVGYDIVEYSPEKWNPDHDKKIVHISQSPSEVDTHYIVECGVLGNLEWSLNQIAERARPNKSVARVRTLTEYIEKELNENREHPGFPVKPQRMIADLRDVMRDEDIVVSDVGAHKLWIARLYPCQLPNTCIISNGFASMGIGVPGAMAAKLLYPERNVVTVCGDAGFLMQVQELETAVREKIPFVALIPRDDGYGLITWKQQNQFGRSYGTTFGNPDFVKLAESFGAKGYRIGAADELKPVLQDALQQQVPAVIDCPIDYSENLKLTERLGNIACPI